MESVVIQLSYDLEILILKKCSLKTGFVVQGHITVCAHIERGLAWFLGY